MNNYSDIIFLIGAIAIYGLLMNDTNQSVLVNNHILTKSEIEYGAISTAQDILDKAKWMKYDDATKTKLESLKSNSTLGWYTKEVDISTPPACPSSGECKRIDVKVTSNYSKNADSKAATVTMSMIKTKH